MEVMQLPGFMFWKGTSTFHCKGKIMLGPDQNRFWITLFLINAAIIVFVPTVGIYFIVENSNPVPLIFAIIWCGITNWTFLKGALSDPGYLLRFEPPLAHAPVVTNLSNLEGYKFDPIRYLRRQGYLSKVKYCSTCKIYRPPRASHWSDWDAWVEGFDHHCPWLGNWVGKMNYRYFLAFLVSVVTSLIILLSWCVAMAANVAGSFVFLLENYVFLPLMIMFGTIALWLTSALLIYHITLLVHGITTNEYIKDPYELYPRSPFTKGSWFKNLMYIIERAKALPSFPRLNTLQNIASEFTRQKSDEALQQFSGVKRPVIDSYATASNPNSYNDIKM